ncbi:MAG: hypothetical protein ABIO70_30055 [Pseudomonadota bacterium]
MSASSGWALEAAALAALVLNAGLALGVGIAVLPARADWSAAVPEGPPLRPPTAAHPVAPPPDPAPARAESCGRLQGLFDSLEGQLSREGLVSPVPAARLARLVSEGSCTLDDPAVRAVLDRYRAAFTDAGLAPPPLLPQVER